MTLQELFNEFDTQTPNTWKYIQTEYNDLVPTTYALSEEKAQAIAKTMKYMLNPLMSCDFVGSTSEKGISLLKSIIKTHILDIGIEYERITISLDKQLTTMHSQTKFAPVDNSTDIEKEPTRIDDTTFNHYDNFVMKCKLMCESTELIGFFQDIRTILRTTF